MKLFAKFMIAALFIAMLLPFTILKGPDGKTLMSFSDFDMPDFSMPSLPDASSISSSDDSPSGKDLFYKWYDAEGNVQFTTEPPAEGIEYTVKGFDPNTNLIQAVEIPEEKPEPDKAPQAENTEDKGSLYTKEGIEKLFKDAKDVEKLLNQRMKDQESALNQ